MRCLINFKGSLAIDHYLDYLRDITVSAPVIQRGGKPHPIGNASLRPAPFCFLRCALQASLKFVKFASFLYTPEMTKPPFYGGLVISGALAVQFSNWFLDDLKNLASISDCNRLIQVAFPTQQHCEVG